MNRKTKGEYKLEIGKSATRAKNKYNSANYDRIPLVVPKGKKAEYKAFADAADKSLNAFIIECIERRTQE